MAQTTDIHGYIAMFEDYDPIFLKAHFSNENAQEVATLLKELQQFRNTAWRESLSKIKEITELKREVATLKGEDTDTANMTREQRLTAAANIITATCKKYDVTIEDFSYGDGFDLRVTITHDHTTESKKLDIDDNGFEK